MAPPKAKRGRGGSSQGPGERETKGRKISSTSSTRTLNPSPPSVTRRPLPPPQFSDLTPPPQKVQTPSHSSHSNRKGVHQRRSNNLIPEESLVTPQRSKVSSRPAEQGGPHIDRVVEDQQSPLQHHGMEDDEVADDADNTDDDDDGDAGDDDADDADDADDDGAHQEPSVHLSLQALLSAEGRSDFLDTLSPIKGQGFWFDRDPFLTKNIAKIIQEKFDGAYYSWSVTPKHVQDRYFVQLAQRYTWDYRITHMVRDWFDSIAGTRLKGMINYVRGTRKRPNWIPGEVWKQMEKYWDTDDAKERSQIASAAHMSDRDGNGPHVHTGGPKSNDQHQREMELKLGRPVSIGEVFVKTHTRKDGTFVDRKAKKVAETYDHKLQSALSQLQSEVSMTSDCASRTPTLTKEQLDDIFLESTFHDERGNPYGIGSLAKRYRKANKAVTLDTSAAKIQDLEKQLKEAREKMDEQATQNKLFLKYLQEKDPNLPTWLKGSTKDATEEEPESTPSQPNSTT